jgi:MATE family multidrug resistance protein
MSSRHSASGELFRLAWPIYVAQLAILANAAIDTLMAGRLSALDLAAVGVAASIQATVLMSVMGVLLALPPLVARLQGAGRAGEIGHEVWQGLWLSLALAVLVILLLRHPEPFIALSRLQPAVEVKVRDYLDAFSWGVPAAFVFRLFFGFSTGIGRPRPVMLFNVGVLALKVPLNLLFMHGLLGAPALGAAGCAVATAIDFWVIAGAAWIWCLRQPDYARYQLHLGPVAPDLGAIRDFLRLGIPIGLTFLADVTAFTFMALFIARLGPLPSAAHQIAANLSVLAFMLPMSLGNAAAVLVGRALGAGDPRLARRYCARALVMGFVLALLVSTAFWSAAPAIVAAYTPDPVVQRAALPLILLIGFYHLADAFQVIAVNALRGYKKTTVPMLVYTLTLWGLGLGGGVMLGLTDLLGDARGAAGFWIAAIASLGVVAAWMGAYLARVSREAGRSGLE